MKKLKPEVALAATFLKNLIEKANFSECFSYFSDHLKSIVSLEQLAGLGEYYSGLSNLWWCLAFSFQQSSMTVVFVPLYFANASYQAKLWISSNQIDGMEITPLDEDKWTDEGTKERWVCKYG
jgi:hypothetical protein